MSYKSLEWRVPYSENFRYNAHRLIAIGYRKALPQIKSSARRDETHTTGFIAEAIDGWLNQEEPEGFDGYSVLDDPPERSYGGTRAGRSRLRSDLVITYSNRPRNRFVCEAKRLKSGRGVEYIGSDGMGCFISGNYAQDYLEVAMLGYVETKEYNKVERRALAAYKRKKRRTRAEFTSKRCKYYSRVCRRVAERTRKESGGRACKNLSYPS